MGLDMVNAIAVIVGGISILGAAGSFSVLFYRVRQLEITHQEHKEEFEKEKDKLTEMNNLLIKIETKLDTLLEDKK